MLNFDALALGAVVDGMPGIMGDGRVSLGGLAGWQPRIGSHRYQLLGELGAERFSDVGGTLLSSPSARETWLDYAGVRLGVTETFGGDGPSSWARGCSSARISARRTSAAPRATS